MGDPTKPTQELARLVIDMDVDGIVAAVQRCLEERLPASRILSEGRSAGMRKVGELFKNGEVYMPEVLVSRDVYDRGLETVRPYLGAAAGTRGGIVLGTIHGDIHTVGKDVAIPVFQAAGYEVIEPGVDVPDHDFVAAIQQHRPHIVGLGSTPEVRP